MDQNEIRREYKKQRHNAKNEYRAQRHMIRETYEAELDIYYSSAEFKNKANPPRRSVLEEIGNAVTHGVGAIFAIIGFVLMLTSASTKLEYFAASIYFIGLFEMFTMSCLYHSFKYGTKVKRVFRRFDYCSIYLLIGATFAPILLCSIGGTYGIVFFSIQWAIIITGVTLVSVFGPNRLHWFHTPLYCLLGWSALLLLPKIISISTAFFWYTLAGGIIYTIGIIPFAIPHKVSHFLWHFFVLIAAVVQWVGIYLYIYLK